MLAQEEYVEVHALRRRGWSISAIARHLGRDRKTVRAHLAGERVPGRRRPTEPDPFDTVEAYVRQRLADDPHLWATALFDEVTGLGYGQSYPTFVRKIRDRGLRPSCGACAGTRGRPTVVIDHPPAEECQWDWVELRDTPWGSTVSVLVGVLSHSGKFRAWISSCQDQAHLVEGIDAVLRRFGGTARRWRMCSDGHRRGPGHRPHTAIVRGSGQTLRSGDRPLPAEAAEPQRRSRKSHPLPVPALVAHRCGQWLSRGAGQPR